MKCKICDGDFKSSPDSVLLCGHKEGAVHLGCCINNCSWNKQPCGHSTGTYEKLG
ncbi:hypothetical protein KY366_02670 [Candidatus Woesearchaeota archaeon]|nr:hypothetical protein [Candidatus Woesearchaeota archaeon]